MHFTERGAEVFLLCRSEWKNEPMALDAMKSYACSKAVQAIWTRELQVRLATNGKWEGVVEQCCNPGEFAMIPSAPYYCLMQTHTGVGHHTGINTTMCMTPLVLVHPMSYPKLTALSG